jgi:Tfp pilus assembly protein PilF
MNTWRIWLVPCLLVWLAGCGSRQMPASQLRSSQSSYAAAVEALEAKDYAAALDHFTTAIDEAGLNADQFAEAQLRSAECHIELGNLEEAAAVLEALSDHAPEMDQYHLVCCKLYSKQGDTAKARAAYEAAREINPTVEPPIKL